MEQDHHSLKKLARSIFGLESLRTTTFNVSGWDSNVLFFAPGTTLELHFEINSNKKPHLDLVQNPYRIKMRFFIMK